eukprot:TRINITY_DN93562_c0_g1_i1.p1 TRINITY_DN93562_c0_g1~~TRINITY_DN93562_c0_g1_i1.p1  ORF type:complete len:190 (+),score=38.73 TRINITY_DN93562_c0_g1_i1:47-571(+)
MPPLLTWVSEQPGALASPWGPTSFSGKKSEGLQQIEQVMTMLKEQTNALAELHMKVKVVEGTAHMLKNVENDIHRLEHELGDAKKAAEQIVGVNTGLGQLAIAIQTIKAKAEDQKLDLLQAKDSLDPLIPSNTHAMGMHPAAIGACLLFARPGTLERRSKGQRRGRTATACSFL